MMALVEWCHISIDGSFHISTKEFIALNNVHLRVGSGGDAKFIMMAQVQ